MIMAKLQIWKAKYLFFASKKVFYIQCFEFDANIHNSSDGSSQEGN